MSTNVVCMILANGMMRPANQAEASKLDDLLGREVMAKVSQPRNLRFHRKGFALLHAIYELADTDKTFEVFRKLLVAEAGHGDFIHNGDQLVFVPKSLEWGRMDETEFNRVYQDILTVGIQKYGADENAVNQLAQFA